MCFRQVASAEFFEEKKTNKKPHKHKSNKKIPNQPNKTQEKIVEVFNLQITLWLPDWFSSLFIWQCIATSGTDFPMKLHAAGDSKT